MPHQPFPARQFSRIGLTPDEIPPKVCARRAHRAASLTGRLRVDDGQTEGIGLLLVCRQSVRNLGHHFAEARFWRASGSANRRPDEAIILRNRCRAEVLPSPSRYRLMQ